MEHESSVISFSELPDLAAEIVKHHLPSAVDKAHAAQTCKSWCGFFLIPAQRHHLIDLVYQRDREAIKQFIEKHQSILKNDKGIFHKKYCDQLLLMAAKNRDEQTFNLITRKLFNKQEHEDIPAPYRLCYLIHARLTNSQEIYQNSNEKMQAETFIREYESEIKPNSNTPLIHQPCPGGTPLKVAINNLDPHLQMAIHRPYIADRHFDRIELTVEIIDELKKLNEKQNFHTTIYVEQTENLISPQVDLNQLESSIIEDEENYISTLETLYQVYLTPLIESLNRIGDNNFLVEWKKALDDCQHSQYDGQLINQAYENCINRIIHILSGIRDKKNLEEDAFYKAQKALFNLSVTFRKHVPLAHFEALMHGDMSNILRPTFCYRGDHFLLQHHDDSPYGQKFYLFDDEVYQHYGLNYYPTYKEFKEKFFDDRVSQFILVRGGYPHYARSINMVHTEMDSSMLCLLKRDLIAIKREYAVSKAMQQTLQQQLSCQLEQHHTLPFKK